MKITVTVMRAGGNGPGSSVRRPLRHDAALIQALVLATLVIGTATILAGLGRW